jgi:hypothetical protein
MMRDMQPNEDEATERAFDVLWEQGQDVDVDAAGVVFRSTEPAGAKIYSAPPSVGAAHTAFRRPLIGRATGDDRVHA